MSAVLEIEGLSVHYGGVVAVNNVSFSIQRKQLVGLIGPNGAGKTTMIDALSGYANSSGRVVFNGKDISSLAAYRRARMGLCRTFQSLELFEDLTVRENLVVAASPLTWADTLLNLFRWRPDSHDVDWALEPLNLLDVADELPQSLSLGNRKLVAIARAVVSRPSLLLLDEPAAGLDSHESLMLGRALTELVSDELSILMVEHDMGMVFEICDDINVIDFGKLIASGTPQAIRSNPTVVDAYLGVDESEDEGSTEADGRPAEEAD